MCLSVHICIYVNHGGRVILLGNTWSVEAVVIEVWMGEEEEEEYEEIKGP